MGTEDLFDHERLDVYRVTRQLLALVREVLKRHKLSRDMHDQLDRAARSILANIAEGAGKTARADKQRFYEMARGSAMEVASHLDILLLYELIPREQYSEARSLLLRVVKMLSRLCGNPRAT